jgi:acetyl-CoA C-acetyltransferase
MVSQRSVIFAEPVRTAIGTFGGSFKDVPATDLGAAAIGAAVARAGLRSDEVETVTMGNVVQAGTKMNPARQAAVHAGLPVTTPAMTVNRVCGSGAQAIVSAAQEILLGSVDVAVAGGMENMDLAPFLVARGRWGYRLGDGQLFDSVLRDGLNDAFTDSASGWHTEDLVENSRSPARPRTAGRCGRSNGSPAHRLPAISRRRSCRWRCPPRRDRRSLTRTSIIGPTLRSTRSRG